MKILRITDDNTPDELREAITHLRARQRALDGLDADLIGVAIDDLLDQLPRVEAS